MHDFKFADSLAGIGGKVLGLDLLPFAIGHQIALSQRRNYLVMCSLEIFSKLPLRIQFDSLCEAVLICCARRPSCRYLWRRKVLKSGIAEEIKTFFDYISCAELATVKIPRHGNATFHYFGAPENARLINYVSKYHALLISAHYGGSPLNFPLQLARHLYQTEMECEGNVWIENHQDVESKMRRTKYEQTHPENTFAVGEDAVQSAAEKWNKEHPNAPVPLIRKPVKGK